MGHQGGVARGGENPILAKIRTAALINFFCVYAFLRVQVICKKVSGRRTPWGRHYGGGGKPPPRPENVPKAHE